jgi:hypothetical protein
VRGSAEQVRHQRRAGGAGELAVGGAGELAVGERSYMSHRRSMVSAGRESGTASKDAVVVSQRSAVEANSAGTCDALAATVRTGGDGGESGREWRWTFGKLFSDISRYGADRVAASMQQMSNAYVESSTAYRCRGSLSGWGARASTSVRAQRCRPCVVRRGNWV